MAMKIKKFLQELGLFYHTNQKATIIGPKNFVM